MTSTGRSGKTARSWRCRTSRPSGSPARSSSSSGSADDRARHRRRGTRRWWIGGEGESAVGRKARYLVGLDVGTSKIAAIVGTMTDDAGLDIVGLGLDDSRGIRPGVVVDLDAAVESIGKAIGEA